MGKLSGFVTLVFFGALAYTIYSFLKERHIKNSAKRAKQVKYTKFGAIVTIAALVLTGIISAKTINNSQSLHHEHSTQHSETFSKKVSKTKKKLLKKKAKSFSKQEDKNAINGFQKSVIVYVRNTSGNAPFTVKGVKFKNNTTVMIVVNKSSFNGANPNDIKSYFRTTKDHIDNLSNMADLTGTQLLIVDEQGDGLAGTSLTGKVKINQNL